MSLEKRLSEGTMERLSDRVIGVFASLRLCEKENGRMGNSEMTNYELRSGEFGETT